MSVEQASEVDMVWLSDSPRAHYALVSAALGVSAATLKSCFQPNATLP